MLDYARAGDTVVVTAIDRLGRSVAEVARTVADLAERRILLRALREGTDTATPAERAVAAIMATLAELELELGTAGVGDEPMWTTTIDHADPSVHDTLDDAVRPLLEH